MPNIIEWFKSRNRRRRFGNGNQKDVTVAVYVDGHRRMYFGHLVDFNGREGDDLALCRIVNGMIAQKQHYMERIKKGRA